MTKIPAPSELFAVIVQNKAAHPISVHVTCTKACRNCKGCSCHNATNVDESIEDVQED